MTQFQFVGSVERISEHYLLPLLEKLLEAFPFRIRGFHSDNGCEFVNYQVAALLEKLRIEQFTKSRPRPAVAPQVTIRAHPERRWRAARSSLSAHRLRS